ncbi:MAG: hypothetical protein KAW14_06250 [Candidatus Aegiribacteria sp.]|nr:hypothetical protein [Candidatus Aegiribacteria sp.]
MAMVEVREMLLWCSILNMGLLILMFLTFLMAGKRICRIHGKLWDLPEEKVRLSIYRAMATYKMLVFLLCIIPYAALRIIG